MVRKLRGSSRHSNGTSQPTLNRDVEVQRAAAHYNAGRLAEAATIYAALCAHDRRDATAWFLGGLVSFQRELLDDAERQLRTVLDVCNEPALRFEAATWLAKTLRVLRRPREACEVLLASSKDVWDDAAKLWSLFEPIMQAGGFEDLEPLLRRVVALSPDHAAANAELSLFDFRRRDLGAAFQRAAIALEREPRNPAALRVQAHIHHDVGEVKKAASLYRDAVEQSLAGRGETNILAVYESMLGALVYADVSDDELRTAHENWRTLLRSTPRARKFLQERGDRPLRIGYVSPDYRHHAVAFFFEPLLQNHDPAAVTPILYSNSTKVDHVTERLRARAGEEGWRDITSMDDVQAADLIERDRIDILVDLAGYTLGNRMGVFHLRPAPLQVNYLGYPCTTGLAEMDYRFTDEDCDPLGETDKVYTEKLVRLPGGFYAWQPPEEYPSGTPPPALKNGYITFGSLNTLAKLTDDVIELWSRLMQEVVGSRLILQADPFSDEWVRQRILKKFELHGVDASRIELHRRSQLMVEHLELYNRIDIALDPFPWGGHTTTCTALFMSVPVVTLRGRRMASRMSASVLHRMGFDAWIADTREEYIEIAKVLAADVDRLATIRLAQRTVFSASGVMDGNRLARVIEAAYQAIWDHHAGGT